MRKTFVENLRYAADKLKAAGIRLVMEMINTRDIPGFYLNTTKQAPKSSRSGQRQPVPAVRHLPHADHGR